MMFQSTPPHGGRQTMRNRTWDWYLFQSTPPHGGRPAYVPAAERLTVFQSTPPHGGRREDFTVLPLGLIVSIHAPARGIPLATGCLFQSTSRDSGRRPRSHGEDVSIHAPARGATGRNHHGGHAPRFSKSETSMKVKMFQSTPPHGGRRSLSECLSTFIGFNPRPRTGSDCTPCGPLC